MTHAFLPLLRRRCVDALGFSLAGFRRAWQEEAFRVEVCLAIPLTPLALWLGGSPIERVVLVGSLAVILIVELLNTAVEVVVDRISVERHPLSKQAKDLGSAAVLVALLFGILVWSLVLWPTSG
ncbi:MAG: diacylglycerol kinase [Burkholderiaceae bacterium]